MVALLTIAGGVALLVFGLRYLRKGLDRLFGKRLSTWMGRLGGRPAAAFCAGLGTSVLAPSSTTISLLAVQTVQSGAMTARQMLMVMFGANIGLTVLVQFMALDLQRLAPIAILFGVLLFQFTQRSRSRGVGQVILAFGFMFLAMGVIRETVAGMDLASHPDFVQIIGIAQRYPFTLAIAAAGLTIAVQSSTVTIALAAGLATGSAVELRAVVPVVLGANVGMSLTTLFVGWRQIHSRRLGLANLIAKSGVALGIGIGFHFLEQHLREPAPESIPAIVALLHTGFNVLVALLGIPAVDLIDRAVIAMTSSPTAAGRSEEFGPKFIHNGSIDGVALAMAQSTREIGHMAEIIRNMLVNVWIALKSGDELLAREVAARDDDVDRLDAEIKGFLTRLFAEDDDAISTGEQMAQFRCLSELETIGDVIDRSLAELTVKKIQLGVSFSDEGARQLDDFHERVVQNFDTCVTAFVARDFQLTQQALRIAERLDRYDHELRERHFQRLNSGETGSHETSAIHLDILTNLKRINASLHSMAEVSLATSEARDPVEA